jgi:hypothetical protein
MIVRIIHEGQFRIPGADLDRINEIDTKLVDCVAAGDEASFKRLLAELLTAVKEHGKPVPVDEFVESDVILPPEDSTLEEVKELFTGEGAIPG